MTDIAKIAAGLTKAQQEALTHPNAGGCSYRWAKIGTLEALYARNLIAKRTGLGSMFSPQTSIHWPLRPIGIAVRTYLENQP
jgi:hypothetical protein